AEKDGGGGVYVVAAEIGPEFEVMPARRQTEVVDELKAPLRSIRRRRELAAEYADAGQPDARSERVHSVDVVSVAYELEAEFIRRPAAENVRLAENDGVVSTTYVEARGGPKLTADADVVLTVVGQTASEENKILFAQAVVHPDAAHARILNQGGCAVRTGEQVEGASVKREWAVRRGGEQRLKLSTLRCERRRARSYQRRDQVLLICGRLQDRTIGQDRRETRFAPDQ